MTYEPTYLGEIELSENTLKHYGVKGMKWRNRRGKTAAYNNVRRRGKGFIMGDEDGDGEMEWANKRIRPSKKVVRDYLGGRIRTPRHNVPTSRKRNITGSGSGVYRKGSKLGYRVGGR